MATQPPPHLQFASAAGNHLYVSAYSRLFDLPAGLAIDAQSAAGAEMIEGLSRAGPEDESLALAPQPNPQSVSLNIAASCNLACGYCYAGQGEFDGRQTAAMSWDTARATVDRLLDAADPTSPITIGFLGGEPFLNRPLLHRVTAYAARRAAERELDVRFSVTTNGTLLTDEDRTLLRNHPYAVTVSLDGDAATHDRNRPGKGGRGSWHRTIAGIVPLLRAPGLAQVAARATVRRDDMRLREHLAALAAQGFTEIGFSPLRASPRGTDTIAGADWSSYVEALKEAARGELSRLRMGLPIRLTNLAVALKQIHRGFASPFPCGAGGGYFSVASDGAWYACHRAVGDEAYRLGDNDGLDEAKRGRFLAERHVDAQTDCRSCWARYLCSGGCHQEAAARTPQSCDFVREWLRFCLIAYCELRGNLNPGEGVADARA
ncbi:MAG TPA: radical SAM protein [Allosphingosinicella sp.]|nr:radical SAM protein [Allosphingosinicella sp.]